MGGAAAQLQSNRNRERTLLAHTPLARRRPRTNEHPPHRHRNCLFTQCSALQRCMPARTLTRRVARRAALLARGESTTCSRPLSTPLTSCWFQLHFPERRPSRPCLAGPCLRHSCQLCSCPSWCHCLLSFNLLCFPLKHTSQKFVGEGPASGLTLWTPLQVPLGLRLEDHNQLHPCLSSPDDHAGLPQCPLHSWWTMAHQHSGALLVRGWVLCKLLPKTRAVTLSPLLAGLTAELVSCLSAHKVAEHEGKARRANRREKPGWRTRNEEVGARGSGRGTPPPSLAIHLPNARL